ncbi:MAG: hypothetical protein ACI8S6_004549 [Myxococcota bacterium]|jgi:hypothetical protein
MLHTKDTLNITDALVFLTALGCSLGLTAVWMAPMWGVMAEAIR